MQNTGAAVGAATAAPSLAEALLAVLSRPALAAPGGARAAPPETAPPLAPVGGIHAQGAGEAVIGIASDAAADVGTRAIAVPPEVNAPAMTPAATAAEADTRVIAGPMEGNAPPGAFSPLLRPWDHGRDNKVAAMASA